MKDRKIQLLEIIANILLGLSLWLNSKLIASLFAIEIKWKYLIYYIVCVVIAYVIKYFNRINLEYFTDQRRLELYEHIIFHWDDQSTNASVDLFNRDLVKCVEYVHLHLPKLITDLVIVFIGLLIIARTSILFAIMLILFGFIQIILPIKMNKKFQINYQSASKLEDDMNQIYSITTREFSKLHFFTPKYMLSRITPLYYDYYLVGSRSEKTATIYGACKDLLSIIGKFGLCFIALMICYYTKVDLAEMIASVYLGGKLTTIFLQIFHFMKIRSEYIISHQKISNYYLEDDYPRVSINESIILENVELPFNQQILTNCFQQGDKVLIKGKNGSGKSTFIRILLGLNDPKDGIVRIDHEVYDKFLLDCFYVPQFNVSLNISFEDLKKCFGIEKLKYENKNLNELSSGQYRFSLLEIAFQSNQKCIILDEPEDNLDEAYRIQLLEMIKNYNGLLFIATNRNDYDHLCNKVVNIGE